MRKLLLGGKPAPNPDLLQTRGLAMLASLNDTARHTEKRPVAKLEAAVAGGAAVAPGTPTEKRLAWIPMHGAAGFDKQ